MFYQVNVFDSTVGKVQLVAELAALLSALVTFALATTVLASQI